MKTKYGIVAALSLAAIVAFAQEAKTDAPEKADKSAAIKKISALEATNYLGKMMIVTGKVAQVSVRPTITFINLDQPYPKSPFAAIVFPSAADQFKDVKSLKGKNVEIKGKIAEHSGKPQIVLNSSNQLHVVEQQAAETK